MEAANCSFGCSQRAAFSLTEPNGIPRPDPSPRGGGVGWRQAGGCTPEGPRESDAERNKLHLIFDEGLEADTKYAFLIDVTESARAHSYFLS